MLVKEEDKVQKLMYYVSKVFIGVKTRYLKIEKLAYTLMIITRKLCYYFQAHPIVVLTYQPLKQITQWPDTSRQLLKWSIKLREFLINYRPRMINKAQALANFIAEFTHDVSPHSETKIPEE